MFKKIIGIASCKGGVGKSTLAVNIAIHMANFKKNISLFDADIYGPSHPTMLGIDECNSKITSKLLPKKKFGIQSMSVGYFLNEKDAILFRGPMASNTIKLLIKNTLWEKSDMLIIDFPPGTGDIYLTLLRDFNLDGILLVSTPQTISTIDVKKTIIMLKTFNIKILGLIENMAYYKCNHCNNINNLYGDNTSILDLIKNYNINNHYRIEFDENINKQSNKDSPFSLEQNTFKKEIEKICTDTINFLY